VAYSRLCHDPDADADEYVLRVGTVLLRVIALPTGNTHRVGMGIVAPGTDGTGRAVLHTTPLETVSVAATSDGTPSWAEAKIAVARHASDWSFNHLAVYGLRALYTLTTEASDVLLGIYHRGITVGHYANGRILNDAAWDTVYVSVPHPQDAAIIALEHAGLISFTAPAGPGTAHYALVRYAHPQHHREN